MERNHTYLHLALKLKEKINIDDFDSFCLGCVCPEDGIEWGTAKEDFTRGKAFGQWAQGKICRMDIAKYDAMICDMEAILPLVERLREGKYQGEKQQALENILALEQEPVPLYLVCPEQKIKYAASLERLAEEFCKTIIK